MQQGSPLPPGSLSAAALRADESLSRLLQLRAQTAFNYPRKERAPQPAHANDDRVSFPTLSFSLCERAGIYGESERRRK